MKEFKVLILVNPNKDENLSFTKEVIHFLKEKHCQVFIEKEIEKEINEPFYIQNTNIDFAIVLGGDGTLLNKLHTYIDCDFPFFGINLGRVGCLLEGKRTNYKQKIVAILESKYIIEKRNSLAYKIELKNETLTGIAFNEVSLSRGNLFKMLRINLSINQMNKTSFYADGVIVATSTGSSAYNLSCGGPLLLPSTKNFVITPVSPQLRCITSLVINDSDEIEIDVREKQCRELYHNNHPIVVIDGKTRIEIDENTKITLVKSLKEFRIIKIKTNTSLFEPPFKVALSSQELFKNE